MGNPFDSSMQAGQFFDAIEVTPSDSDALVDSGNANKPIKTKAVMIVNDDGSPGTLAYKSFTCVDRAAEVLEITCPEPTDLDGKGFIMYDDNSVLGVWFDGTGTTPDPLWLEQVQRTIKVDVSAAADDEAVAAALATALDGDASFAASAVAEVVTCTDAKVGARELARDLPGQLASGVEIERTTAGMGGSQDVGASRIARAVTLPSGVIVPIVTDQILDTGTDADKVLAFY